MAILRSRFRGAIHLSTTADGGRPEVEFDGGEGPEQIMDQIQTFAVPWIRKAVEGSYILWEELETAAGRLRRHRSLFGRRLELEICSDDQGIELLLPRTLPETSPGDGRAEVGKVWVPLRALAEPGRRHRAALGWTVAEPRFLWRYVEIGRTPTLEMTWSCDNIYRSWAGEIRRLMPSAECRLGDGSVCRLTPMRGGPLSYRGHLALAKGSWLPARRRLWLKQPFVVAGEDGEPPRVIDDDVPVSVEALDFRAVLGEKTTRLVSLDDLAHRFETEVLTSEETLLPAEIPAGMLPGLPWTLAVEPRKPENAGRAPSNGEVRMHPAARHRRWVLSPQGDVDGYWGQVEWEDYPPVLRFGMGSTDLDRTPKIARIQNRRATVGWRLETSEDDGELLCFTIPHWVPMGQGASVALPCRDNGFDYASEVTAEVGDLEERFAIDPSSEVPANRVFLDPRRWSFYDERLGEIHEAEALGEVSGFVRWRRPGSAASADDDVSPTDWAGGSAPVLLVRRSDAVPEEKNVLDWGGLYAPEAVPWEALQEVRPERTVDDDLVLTPRASLPAVWISLWGFVSRYDRREVVFTQREPQAVTAWIARAGLELFPGLSRESAPDARGCDGAGRGFLIRSFAPLYAVRDRNPRVLSLEPGAPRPVLRLGRDLLNGKGPRAVEIGDETYVRYQAMPPGRLPESFGPGRIPGTPLHISAAARPRQVVWLALEQGRGAEGDLAGRRAGYLLSWDAAAGWRFRGFFTHANATVKLGSVRLADQSLRVFLGDEFRAGRRAFRLEIDSGGHRWSEAAPERITELVTSRMIADWERRYYARDQLPEPLRDHEVRVLRQPVDGGPWIFELLKREEVFDLDPPAGIRVWEPQEGVAEDLLAGVRLLGDDEGAPDAEETVPAEVPEERGPPKKKLLRADDDDDDF